MARRTAREKLDLFLQNHRFMGRRSTRWPERTHFQDLRLRGRERQPVETTERQSISHHLLRSKVGQRMPLMQRQDLEHRQRRTPGAPLAKAWIGASRASNAGPPNASISPETRRPPVADHHRVCESRLEKVTARHQRRILSDPAPDPPTSAEHSLYVFPFSGPNWRFARAPVGRKRGMRLGHSGHSVRSL